MSIYYSPVISLNKPDQNMSINKLCNRILQVPSLMTVLSFILPWLVPLEELVRTDWNFSIAGPSSPLSE